MKLTRRQFGAIGIASIARGRTAWADGTLADMPASAIDCHNHIIGPIAHYPMVANRIYTPPEASVAQLRALRTELGVARNVIVQPSFYGFDNSCLVDTLAELGTSARGIAVVPLDVSDAELRRLAVKGVTGVRLNLSTFGVRDPKVAIDAIKAFEPRFAPMDWHIQINTGLAVVEAIAPTVADLKIPVVFDHMANLDAEKGVNQPGFGALVALVKARNAYVKLSAPYNLSRRPDWSDVTPLAEALIAAAPDRMLWGTNWPHPGNVRGDITKITPYRAVDNPALLRFLGQEVTDVAMRKMILLDTPARLYGFA
jgi:2-pyrone-4,6-dicarboxylate lactonase